ncbi:MAG: sigma-70 family RNA polymerase sigma factor [Ilumatobacteraceae bacterium]
MEADVDRRKRFESAVAEVYEPLQRYLGRRAQAEDVSELLNDALLVLWRRLDDVPIDDLRPWSYGVAKLCLANSRRGNNRRLRLVGRLTADPLTHLSHGQHAPSDDGHDELTTALNQLDDSERELVRLWAWEQLEPREIAIALDTTANAVSLRLTRAKKKIASSMRQSGASGGHEAFGHREEARP